MPSSTNLGLPYIDANQNQKYVTHNTALQILDALVQIQVQSATLTAPPGSPADGQVWIVATGATGAWLGKDLQLAAWQDGAWAFYAPRRGYIAYNIATSTALLWNGSSWGGLAPAFTTQQLTALGIGTAPDSGNPLSVTANNALFNAAGGGDVRIKLNKAAAGNTASFVFQDGFSGRAEIGLLGDDSFHFKVSSDGSAFYDSIVIAAAGGVATFLSPPAHPTPAAGNNSNTSATTAYVERAIASAPAFGAASVNLGTLAAHAGHFTLSDSRIAASSRLIVQLGPGPYAGKGTLADEAEMYAGITFAAAPASGQARVSWSAPRGGIARGNVNVNYIIG